MTVAHLSPLSCRLSLPLCDRYKVLAPDLGVPHPDRIDYWLASTLLCHPTYTLSDHGDAVQQEQNEEEEIVHMNSIIDEIWALYNANTPLFIKDAVRRVAKELKLCRESASGSRKVAFQGINGVDYETVTFQPHMSSRTRPLRGSKWLIYSAL
jgi:hypothetical protein